MQRRKSLRRYQGQPPQIAVTFKGLDESVGQANQASSEHREVCLVQADIQVSRWAENETSRLLRVSREGRGTERRFCTARLFDNESQIDKRDSRRRQDPDNQRREYERARGHRTVHPTLAD